MNVPNRIDWDTDTIRMEQWQDTVALVVRTGHGTGFVAIPFDDVEHARQFLRHRASELNLLDDVT